jgi:hypothetical protein
MMLPADHQIDHARNMRPANSQNRPNSIKAHPALASCHRARVRQGKRPWPLEGSLGGASQRLSLAAAAPFFSFFFSYLFLLNKYQLIFINSQNQ